MKLGGVHHIGIAVEDLEKALKFFSGFLGLEVVKEVVVEEQGMKAAWLRLGNIWLELMEPLAPDTPVGKFLAKRGEGVQHVAVLVDDIRAACRELAQAGIRLVYEEPRRAKDGTLYNFVHPKSAHGILLELRAERGYEFLEHTADQYVRAYGPDLKAAFEEAAKALFATMTDLWAVRPEIGVEVAVEGEDLKALLYNWLEALLVKFDTEGLLLREFEVLEISRGDGGPYRLRARARGERFDPGRHPQYVGVKGITYHLMEIEEEPGRVEFKFLLDI